MPLSAPQSIENARARCPDRFRLRPPSGRLGQTLAFAVGAMKSLWTVIALGLAVQSLRAEPVILSNFDQISADQGLPRQSVRAMAQSPEGIVWLGLENGGLGRYDAHSFELYSEASPEGKRLSDDHVEAIVADDQRNIWIGTARGLNRLERDTGKIQWYQHQPGDESSLRDDRISALKLDSQGHLWIGTDAGLCYLDLASETFVSIPPPAGLPVSRIRNLFLDREGRLWVMSNTEVYQVDTQTFAASTLPYEANRITPSTAYCGTQDPHGSLWFSTALGHIVYNPESQSIEPFPILKEDGTLRPGGGAVAITDRQGRIWFGTFAEGLIIIDPDTRKYWIRDQTDLPMANLQPLSTRAMMLDLDGRVWIGTKFHGLLLYHASMESFTHWPKQIFTQMIDSSAAAPLCVEVDANGKVWVGCRRAGITRLDPVTGERSHFEIPPDPERTQSIAFLPDGKILAGGLHGIAELDPETGATRYAPIRGVFDIVRTPSGQILLGTEHGIRALQLDRFELTQNPQWSEATHNRLGQIRCKAIHLDGFGNLWIASVSESIYRVNLESGSIDTLEDLARNQIPEITEARAFLNGSDGNLWIASKTNGLLRFEPQTQTVTLFSTKDGLPSKACYGLLQDRNGDLWISGDQGISRFRPDTGEVSYFGTQHGLQGEVFEPNGQAIGPNGQLFFVGQNGLNAFFPRDILSSSEANRLILTEMRIANKVFLRDRARVDPLQLAHDENQIMISFALLDFGTHGRNQYSYKMRGLADDWVDIGTRQTVSFNYLPAGNYELEVRARAPSSTWTESSPTASLRFHIAAPFWQTWPFRVAVLAIILLVLLGIYLAIYFRGKLMRRKLEGLVQARTQELQAANRQLTDQKGEIERSRKIIERHRDELEETVQQRTKELESAKNKAEESDRLKSSFLANMSHEIRTPMNAIVGLSSMIGLDQTPKEERREFSKVIKSNCFSLLRLVEDILDLSAIDSGQLTLNTKPFLLNATLRELSDRFANQLSERDPTRFQLRIDLPSNEEATRITSDPFRLKQILYQLTNNAIKFTESGYVHATYSIDRTRQQITFSVEDTGIGMEPKNLDAIWDRFRKIEDDTTVLFRGSGLGLSVTKHLVELLGGEIKVSSTKGKGSHFQFTLPLIEAPSPRSDRSNDAQKNRIPANGQARLPTVLVAEDEDSNFFFLSRQITPEKAHIIRAYNGQEAIDICNEDPDTIELIFMDIKMPILDGKEAAGTIKKFAPHIPIIANTAYATPSDQSEMRASVFDEYLTKPTSRTDIARILNRYLGIRN